MNIIIVDDNKPFTVCLKYYLEKKLGYNVLATFNDSQEFLSSGVHWNSDIILMDIEMPKVNGILAAKIAKWKIHDLKIIAVTGYREKAYLNELIGAGYVGCVFKDNIYSELEKAIEKVLTGKYYFPKEIKYS